MALPPIIANNPLVKFLRTSQLDENKDVSNRPSSSPKGAPEDVPEDVIEISEAARQHLQDSEEIKSSEQALQVSSNIGRILENTDAVLGLDSNFS